MTALAERLSAPLVLTPEFLALERLESVIVEHAQVSTQLEGVTAVAVTAGRSPAVRGGTLRGVGRRLRQLEVADTRWARFRR